LESYNFLNELPIAYLHVFTYSERDNTEAADFDGVVPLVVRKKRSKMLRGLSVKKRRAFYESQIGKSKTVLFENEVTEDGFLLGFTENYVRVKYPYDPGLQNTLTKIALEEIDKDGICMGKIQVSNPLITNL